MTQRPDLPEVGQGFVHRDILDPLSREPVLCQFTRRVGDACQVRPLVVVAYWHHEPDLVFHQPCGHGRAWGAWTMPAERLAQGLLETRDVREHAFVTQRLPLPERLPHERPRPRKGLRFLHRSLLAPYTWRPLLGEVLETRDGDVCFAAVVEVQRREHLAHPYGGQERSGHWRMPVRAFIDHLVAPVA